MRVYSCVCVYVRGCIYTRMHERLCRHTRKNTQKRKKESERDEKLAGVAIVGMAIAFVMFPNDNDDGCYYNGGWRLYHRT